MTSCENRELPSLARLYSAAASPSERLRLDGSLGMSRLTRRIKETSNFNYTIVIHTGDFTVSKHALRM